MKPKIFDQATGFLPATTIGEDGKPQPLNYHFWAAPNGKLNITCIEVTDEDIEALKESKKFYLVLPGPVPAPFTAQVKSPFEPVKPVILGANGQPIMNVNNDKAIQDKESAGNNEQHHNGDNQPPA